MRKNSKLCRWTTEALAHIPDHVTVPAKDGAGFQNPNNSSSYSQKRSFSSLLLFHPFPLTSSPLPAFLSIHKRLPEHYQPITHKGEEVKSQMCNLIELFLGDRNPFPLSNIICLLPRTSAFSLPQRWLQCIETEGVNEHNNEIQIQTIREFGIYFKCKKYT